MSNEEEYVIDYEEDEEYNEVIDNIIKQIFKKSITLTKEDYLIFDKVRNHKFVSKNNYEILETLGDGLLKPIIIEAIIETKNNKISESYISELRMLLEKTETFSYLLKKHFEQIINYINFIQTNNPYNYEKIKEDIFEALIGAIYTIIYKKIKNKELEPELLIDLNEYYKNIFKEYIKDLEDNKEQLIVNNVKKLSEYCMKHNKKQPYYKYKKINTPNNGIMYEMTVYLDYHKETCQKKTEKEAKQTCAYLMLKHLNIIQNQKILETTPINSIVWTE